MKFDDIKKLHQKKYRQQFGHYLVEGEHLILELQKAVAQSGIDLHTIQLFVTEKYQDWSSPFEKRVVSSKQMTLLSDTKSPQGIIACVPLPESAPAADQSVSDQSKSERCIYLHEVQDPGNLGTILRTLAWFGGFRLLLSPNSVDPYNSKVVRSSMGAIFHVPMELEVSLDDLAERFDRFAYLDMNGEIIKSEAFADFPCYLFGNEARGVPREALTALNATAFTIPGNGAIESLNLASAVNMSVFQLSV
ncbi:TrmH family RNA methyltransferase [Litoribrevibacter albus]|uniref:23S rRNA methyltransferase n=1 Tax=Litoribrevibacter albus TaxID=1473156 RepID=A0AA37SC65_9GAMM|nr:RNA methyltransferase [Litoribrevibacter albus]GLQ32581.1 23S rRNA methyltransferase [Litoribrevibacter albus]